MNVRKITPHEMLSVHFPQQDVLQQEEDKYLRKHKLQKAMALSSLEHEDVGIIFKADTGELIETYSTVIDYAGDYVELKGGYYLPVWAIVDVEP